jgi:spore germination cell wall hydrolase CwlJ-like protein
MLLLCPIPVSAVDSLTDPVQCMALNIYHEARGEPLKGQYMVAFVTMNRVNSKRYPNRVCDVVKQRNQFSWYKRNTIYPRHIPKSKSWNRAVKIARQVILGTSNIHDNSRGSLWYHAKHVKPIWRLKLTKVSKVGNHIFYRKKSS